MYPRIIQVENDKLKDLILKKGELVNKGRAKDEEAETLNKQMEEIDVKIQEEEKKADIKDLLAKEKKISKTVDKAIVDMQEIKQEIFDRIKAQVTPELYTNYEALEKQKEEKEAERNKCAMKAQKYNDKIIPLAREMMKPFLEDVYEDYDSLYVEDGEIVATIFSYLNDFKINFKRKQ